MKQDDSRPGTGDGERRKHSSMLSAWDAVVARAADAPFLHFFDESLTFGQVDAASDALAGALVADGLGHGDRVAIYLQNDPQWVVTLLATWKFGGTAVPINPMLKQQEVNHLLQSSGARALVCAEDSFAAVGRGAVRDTEVARVLTTHPADFLSEVPPGLARFVGTSKQVPDDADDLVARIRQHAGPAVPRPQLRPDDVAVLTYTSGTTGPPKGAMNTHGNLLHNSEVYRDLFHLGVGDVVLGIAPLSHITGITGHITTGILTGAPLVLQHRFHAEEALRLIERWGATFTVGSITVFIALMESDALPRTDLSSLTKVASGGAPVSPTIVERFESRTGAYIHNVYGMTETTGPALFVPFGRRAPVDAETGALSVGVPVTGAAVSVVGIDTREPVEVGEVGEIVVEGPMVVKGYWQAEEETQHAMPAGRMHTGDVGRRDDEGWYYIVDRAKDQINAAGFKIWPREVEDVLYQHPAVREAVVVGAPDPYRGETVVAFVSLTAGAQVAGEELVGFCRERMAVYKCPRSVEILPELPKTASGKMLRREMRVRAAAAVEQRGVADQPRS